MDQKILRIESLKDEVKELHPLLQKLFPLLPNVTRVEYTHGPNEKGADFVIARTDEVVGGDEYIGVIVKSGDIRQNFDDVERQIKECSMSRTFDGGKKKIVVSEIWVVASGNISHNAQEKINFQFSDKKIKFIWNERVAQLVDKYYPIYWENIDANVGLYLGAVNRQVDELNYRSGVLDVSLSDFYVEQDLVRVEYDPRKKFSIKSKRKPERLQDVVKKERFVLVEAPMGFGKSKLLRQCAKDFSTRKNFSSEKVLPIFLSYRDLVVKYELSIGRVFDELESYHKIEWRGNSVLLLVDGIDEVKGGATEKVENVCEFIRQAGEFADVKVVLASRPFDDPTVDKKIDQYLARYTLQPLTMQRLVKFVERVCSNISVTNRLRNDLHKSDLFKSLPRSPISAILLGRVLSTDIRELPSSLPELYSKYLELAIGRWDIHKGLGSEKEYETSVILLRLMSQYMLKNDLGEISIKDVEQLMADYLEKREVGQKASEILQSLLKKNEVVAVDDVRGVVYFRHRSFLEFMYADLLYISGGKLATLPSPFDPYWGAVIYFYLGRLKDCPEQIAKIFMAVAPDESSVLMRLFHAGDYLLASYQSPYEEITSCVRKTLIEVADVYCKVCENPSESGLGKFSEIHLLAIFTGLVRNAFEYDFFKRALMEVETDVLLSADSDKRKAVASFLIASVRAGLGCSDAFVTLVDNYYASLPASIRLGIIHAADDVALVNDAIKRLRKKLDRNARGDKSVIKVREMLYTVPLDERKTAILI